MQNIPVFVIVLFAFATFFTIFQFYLAAGKSDKVLIAIVVYMSLQSLLAIDGFYKNGMSIPPRFMFLIAPGILFGLSLPFFNLGKKFLDSLDLKSLTLLHAVRLPVEIILYNVFVAGLIPELMTFEGYNFDILSGISAIVVYYIVFVRQSAGTKLLLIWNIACLLLLINIISIAILSAKTPFQQLAFDQPNIGVTYFPLMILPAVIVPAVLVSHIAAIRQLLLKKTVQKPL
jgi:hypothetical protein